MRLKSIKLAGFKSFVDPTTVNFPSNMSSVVGPNGCGKSNIIDAVRWVMGESSAKTLRGESMTDVIFNGTTGRQPVGQASIELLFDNSDGKIVGEYAAYTEISVRRVVGRDATSDYYLNGSKCRRRDITDLFLGTGLGPRSYAIIEQGMISRLIESKPEELRVFIEEAAGISKYKERRRETENRMRRTLENLERLTDLREELERQLQHLQRQAQAAEKYAEFKAEERQLQSQLLGLQWREFQANSTEGKARLGDLEVRIEAERAELERVSSLIERYRLELTEAQDHANKSQADFYAVGSDVTQVEQALRFQQERRAATQQDLDLTLQRLNESRGHLDADKQRLEDWRGDLSAAEPELARLREESEQRQTALVAAEHAMGEWQSEWDEFNQQAAGPKQDAEVQQSRILYLEQVLRRLKDRIEKLEQESGQDQDGEAVDIAAIEARITEADTHVSTREQALEQARQQIESLRKEIDSCRSTQDEQRSLLQRLKGEQASLESLQQAATDDTDSEGLQQWLQGRGIHNPSTLLASLSVAEGWATAVEQVLGHTLAGLCVDDLAALLSPDSAVPGGAVLVEGGGPAPDVDPGTLASKVQGPAVLADWLGGVYVADTVAAAQEKLSSLPERGSVITPEGLWLGRGWLRSPASADPTAGVIEREARLDAVAREIDSVEHALGGVGEKLGAARERRAAEEQSLAQVQRELQAAIRSQADLKAERKTALSRIEQERERRERIDADLAEARNQFEQEQTSLAAGRADLATAIDQMERDGETREQMLSKRDSLREALASARDQSREARDAAHRTDVRAQNLRTQIDTVASTIARLEQQVDELSERSDSLNEQLPDEADPDAVLQAKLESLLERRVQAEAQLTEARQLASEKEHALREQEQARMSADHRVQGLTSDIERERLKQTEWKVHSDNLAAQLRQMETDPQTVVSALPEEATEPEWQVKVERIAARINRLGPINLAAIDECERASERKHYLDAQNEDLESALATLESAIRKIDKETRARFQETFDQVNTGFAELFPRVFGGGTASLELTGDDLLDTGVAIMARPPGKKNSTIHLLSGGEKAMTAIALVFSIFQLNPAPFCMLDEVDAPLDDANVGRYARMVKEMSEKVQFIFITHNKITMEAADQLMGVTMHEPGVSRLVTVDIEEAAQLAAS